MNGDHRCPKVEWKHKARDPLKRICNPCSDHFYRNNPQYKQPRKYVKKDASKKEAIGPLSARANKRIHKVAINKQKTLQ